MGYCWKLEPSEVPNLPTMVSHQKNSNLTCAWSLSKGSRQPKTKQNYVYNFLGTDAIR